MKRENIKLIIFCVAAVIISLLPLFADYIHIHLGMDAIYHINRIEGYAQSIRNFDFFPNFYPSKVNGYGYIGPTFYSDISLIVPAILYNLNIPIIICYKINLFIISLLTAFSMGFCTKGITKSNKVSYLSVVFYIFSQYRLMDIYSRGAVGELFGFIFFPIIIYSSYKMIVENKIQTGNIVIVFSGLLLTHNISFFIGVFLFAVTLLVFYKKIFLNKNMLLSITKAVFITLGITCFYWAPLLEMTFTQDFIFKNGLNRTFELKSSAVDILRIIDYTIKGFNDHTNKLSIGILVIITPIVLILSKFKEKNSFINFLVYFGIFLIFMTTYYFPWDYFGIFATIQFPWRLLTIASACLSIGVSKLIFDFVDVKWINLIYAMLIITTGIYVYQIFQFDKTFNDDATYYEIVTTNPLDKCIEEHNIACFRSSWELAQGNYLNKVSQGRGNWERVITNIAHEVISEDVDYSNGVTSFVVDKPISNEFIIFPVNYYLGIKANAVNINNSIQELETSMVIENAQVKVRLNNPDFRGVINVWYEGTDIQKYSIGISYVSSLTVLLYLLGLKIKSL